MRGVLFSLAPLSGFRLRRPTMRRSGLRRRIASEPTDSRRQSGRDICMKARENLNVGDQITVAFIWIAGALLVVDFWCAIFKVAGLI
jgi:hypothetical protein